MCRSRTARCLLFTMTSMLFDSCAGADCSFVQRKCFVISDFRFLTASRWQPDISLNGQPLGHAPPINSTATSSQVPATTLHTLHQLDPSAAASSDFLVELCRVGSVGWHSHPYMEQVHGRTHLGVSFSEAEVANSHALYAQHVRPLLKSEAVNCEHCRDVAASAPPLPDITVYVITDGKAKDGSGVCSLVQPR